MPDRKPVVNRERLLMEIPVQSAMSSPRTKKPPLWMPLCAIGIGMIPILWYGAKTVVSAGTAHDKVACLQNLRELGGAMGQYAQDWDDRFPPAAHWATSIRPNLPGQEFTKALHCPVSATLFGYALNSRWGGCALPRTCVQAASILIYECRSCSSGYNPSKSGRCNVVSIAIVSLYPAPGFLPEGQLVG